jgi:AcrR family transcriptional regulator
VQVALDLFEQHGYDAVTADEIARQADVSPRTFFRYFDTKADVVFGGFAALVEHLIEALGEQDGAQSLHDAVRSALQDSFGALSAESMRSFRRAGVIMRSADSLRSTAFGVMSGQDARLTLALSRWLPARTDPLRSSYMGTTLSMAMWLVVDDPRPGSKTRTPAALAQQVMELVGAWGDGASAPSKLAASAKSASR